MQLSVIIPSYKDPLLVKTIESLLRVALTDIEIIVVLDGYWPSFKLPEHKQVRYVHLGRNRGMRDAINAGVSCSRGNFIMRTDEHCAFAHGFDQELLSVCQENWIMTMRRYFLNPVTWSLVDKPFTDSNKCYVDYEKLCIRDNKFTGVPWESRDKERANIDVDETMAMQGSCWLMSRSWWNKVIVELQTEGYGPLYQDSHEMVFKTWQASGQLMLDKRVWFAHKHRSFPRTHNNGTKENPACGETGYAYAIEVWGEYYETVVKPKWGI